MIKKITGKYIVNKYVVNIFVKCTVNIVDNYKVIPVCFNHFNEVF